MSNIEKAIDAIFKASIGRDRCIVAIAGAPGAGKSTLSHELVRRLPAGSACAVPMDGFHYDNAVLDQLGLRACKGAPETFDYAGFATLLQRLRRMDSNVAIPLFDREADLARAGASIIHVPVKYILVEGNYLLLDETPWTGLAGDFDLTIFLDVPRNELHRRLMQRWLELDYPEEKAEHWVMSNDMPNVDRVLAHKRREDLTLSEAS